mmetsp:Transcript_37936/g.80651  ORF Transcript_37936/g.80651 Transcript_37936/m.80651 type:complete len:314 (-) Transcript_37936:6-947(-)
MTSVLSDSGGTPSFQDVTRTAAAEARLLAVRRGLEDVEQELQALRAELGTDIGTAGNKAVLATNFIEAAQMQLSSLSTTLSGDVWKGASTGRSDEDPTGGPCRLTTRLASSTSQVNDPAIVARPSASSMAFGEPPENVPLPFRGQLPKRGGCEDLNGGFFWPQTSPLSVAETLRAAHAACEVEACHTKHAAPAPAAAASLLAAPDVPGWPRFLKDRRPSYGSAARPFRAAGLPMPAEASEGTTVTASSLTTREGSASESDDSCMLRQYRPPAGGTALDNGNGCFEVHRFRFVESPQDDVVLALAMLAHKLRPS